jgi:N-acetyl-alpha-D-muramate 1-phosphate uridylyltransferase
MIQVDAAMVLAAGYGTRMRPLTNALPKPLLPLGGRALLDHALDRLREVGVTRAAVNAHWQAQRIVSHLAARRDHDREPPTVLFEEQSLLDTGGSVRAALPWLGASPFYVVNGDAFWLDGLRPALARVAQAWGDDVDAVLLLHRTFQVTAEVGPGDFFLDQWGRPRRRRAREIAPYVYAGVQLAHPRLLDDTPDGPFSLNRCWDRAIDAGRLRAVVHDGLWFHLSTPADLSEAESLLFTATAVTTR